MMVASGNGWWCAGVVAMSCALGCGNSSSSQASGAAGSAGGLAGASNAGGNAGTTAVGGSAGQAGGAGNSGVGGAGGLVLGDSPTEACIAYVLAVCTRQAQCSGGSAERCLEASFACPDLTSSPGATRTVADLQVCAGAYAKLPCEQVESGLLPACVTPGTVPLGQPCRFSSQCASLSCAGELCGACVPSAHEGEACSPTVGVCLGLLTCNEEGKCARRGGSNATLETKGVGEPCATPQECKVGLRCDASSSKCAEYPTLGMSCADTRTCVGGSYCELDGLSCKAYPGQGMSCGVDGFTGGAAYCADELLCSRSSKAVGTCVEPPAQGQPCLLDPETREPAFLACGLSARCDATQTPPTCVSLASKGQPCDHASECADRASCICPDATSSCASRVCGQVQLNAGPCGTPGDVCHPGFSCAAGTCQPKASQGLFAAACGP